MGGPVVDEGKDAGAAGQRGARVWHSLLQRLHTGRRGESKTNLPENVNTQFVSQNITILSTGNNLGLGSGKRSNGQERSEGCGHFFCSKSLECERLVLGRFELRYWRKPAEIWTAGRLPAGFSSELCLL